MPEERKADKVCNIPTDKRFHEEAKEITARLIRFNLQLERIHRNQHAEIKGLFHYEPVYILAGQKESMRTISYKTEGA